MLCTKIVIIMIDSEQTKLEVGNVGFISLNILEKTDAIMDTYISYVKMSNGTMNEDANEHMP